MKKFVGILLILSMFVLFPVITNAAIVDKGVCGAEHDKQNWTLKDGNNLTWTLDDAGVLTISGQGEMADYVMHNMPYIVDSPWSGSGNSIVSVVINEGVTSIGNDAFYGCENITDISIPNSVVKIGRSAFENTRYYNTMENWDNGVLYIDNHLIEAKDEIPLEYSVKDGTIMIAENAFADCVNLNNVIIPDSVIYIGDNAFYNTEYYDNKQNWDSGVFYAGKCLLKANSEEISSEYTIKDETVSICEMAFYDCEGLEKINIPDSVINIYSGAFIDCSRINAVDIPDSITNIWSSAFRGCVNLKKITIPDEIVA